MELVVYDKNAVAFNGITITSFTYNEQDMAESLISADVWFPDEIAPGDWIGCYVTYNSEVFTILESPVHFKDNNKLESKYSVKFEPHKSKLRHWYFLDYVTAGSDAMYTGLAETHFFGNVNEFAGRLRANLAVKDTGWTVVISLGENDSATKEVEFSFDKTYIWDALANMYELLEIPYNIIGKTITIGDSGIDIGTDFVYGQGNGLYSISRSSVAEATYNRIIPTGGDRNMPANYYRDELSTGALRTPYLMPSAFRETSGTRWWYDLGGVAGTPIKELYKKYEDIYPSISGVEFNSKPIDEIISVGSIGSDEILEDGKIKDSQFSVGVNAFGFNLMAHISSLTDMTMVMKSGACSGCTFKITKVNEYSFNKYDYTNNLLLRPLIFSEEEETSSSSSGITVELCSYDVLIAGNVMFSKVKYNPTDIIHNTTVSKTVTVGVDVVLRNLDGSDIRLLTTNVYEVPPSTYLTMIGEEEKLSDILIPAATHALLEGRWIIEATITITNNLSELSEEFGKLRFTANFDGTVPFIQNELSIKQEDPAVPSTSDETITLQKDIDTFGTLLPNAAQLVAAGDKFVLLGIELPESYILSAESDLEDIAEVDLAKSSVQKYSYSLGLDEKYIYENPTIEPKLKCGNKTLVDGGTELLRVTQCSIKYTEEKQLPEYSLSISNTSKPIESSIKTMRRAIGNLSSYDRTSISSTQVQTRQTDTRIAKIEAFAYDANTGSSLGAGVLYEPLITKSTGYLRYTGLVWEFKNETYSLSGHNHDSSYADLYHNHDTSYSDINHNHDSSYANITHDHDGVYSPAAHVHDVATSSANGFLSKEDKQKLDNATDAATADTLVKRSSTSKISVAAIIINGIEMTIE